MTRTTAWQRMARTLCVAVVLPVMVCAPAPAGAAPQGDAAEGERLVHNMDCTVCHTPKVMTPDGPRPDGARLLSGHPADEGVPPLSEGILGSDGWAGAFNAHLTAWAGPWGVSFASNLTPDEATGLGDWSEELFIQSMRTGTHVGDLRPFLPPMPTYDRLTDEELRAIFAYLRSIPPVANEVPEPLPPLSPPPGTTADH